LAAKGQVPNLGCDLPWSTNKPK